MQLYQTFPFHAALTVTLSVGLPSILLSTSRRIILYTSPEQKTHIQLNKCTNTHIYSPYVFLYCRQHKLQTKISVIRPETSGGQQNSHLSLSCVWCLLLNVHPSLLSVVVLSALNHIFSSKHTGCTLLCYFATLMSVAFLFFFLSISCFLQPT